ncbi:NAD-dependent epimerase/dehydratase family protein [Rhizobium mongolense]|uniref:Nucleoside-diphosphate-sugar epimerase n=1 Tax=Rhizobium mongolense TaxID=57676 RepID=A0A7W6RSC5_9HYPH|nr:NAD-dependent epimerase/dehydratase family protein [Rhizobium mongolense]MBB4277736.1 nucleoside-diphosphate-sugar epimerase [Rhizobium mongolense]
MRQTKPIIFDAPFILLTGATGWLGRRVAAALTTGLPEVGLLAQGCFRIKALVPAGEDLSHLRHEGLEIVRGDIRDVESVRAFVAGAEGAVIVHMAGIIHPKTVAQFEAINTQGTINLVAAAQKAGVRRIIVMSSNSPVGSNPHPDHRFTEESPYRPSGGCGHSKMIMEKALRAEIAAGGPTMAYTDNLAQGVLLAAGHPQAAGEIFWLADETPYAMNEIVETVGNVLREEFGIMVKPNKLHLPVFVGRVATVLDVSLQCAGIYHQKNSCAVRNAQNNFLRYIESKKNTWLHA